MLNYFKEIFLEYNKFRLRQLFISQRVINKNLLRARLAIICALVSLLFPVSLLAESHSAQKRSDFDLAIQAIKNNDIATLLTLLQSNPKTYNIKDNRGHNLLWYALVGYDESVTFLESDFFLIDVLLKIGGLSNNSNEFLSDVAVSISSIKNYESSKQITALRVQYLQLIDQLIEMGADYKSLIAYETGEESSFSASYLIALCDSEVFLPADLILLNEHNRILIKQELREVEISMLRMMATEDVILRNYCLDDRLK